jgi:hypothetical protein
MDFGFGGQIKTYRGIKIQSRIKSSNRKKADFALGLMSRKGFLQRRKNFGGEDQNWRQRKTSGGRKSRRHERGENLQRGKTGGTKANAGSGQ